MPAASTPATTSAKPPEPRPPGAEIADKLAAMARAESQAYETVRSIADEVGPRLAGSPGDRAAVAWALATMKSKGFDNVRAEKVKVPHWDRGQESGRIVSPYPHSLAVTTLGGSVGTPPRGIEAEVVFAASIEELEKLDEAKVKGKIAFISTPIERRSDGRGYATGGGTRYRAAAAAAKKGAVAALIRSIGTDHNRLPHTGAMGYEKGVPEIPAAALSVPDAEMLERIVASGKPVRVALSLGAKMLAEEESANVIGEVKGREKPEEIVVLGAHLDSWDLGQGALDDGAGCAVVMEAARLIGKLPSPPRRTIRVVLFANEENGLRGAAGYAKDHAAELDKHVLALESDLGSGKPIGIRFRAGPEAEPKLSWLARLVEPLGIKREPRDAFGGADIGALREAGVPIVDVQQDATAYFDVHHTANDTLDKVNKEELDQMVAAVAIVAHAGANSPEAFGRIPEEKRKVRW
jgi:carboxypeptidase Q